MTKMTAGVLLALATILSAGQRAEADFIVNGSFEQGTVNPGSTFLTLAAGSTAITGWTVTPQSIDYVGGLWMASDGTRSVDLSGNAPGGIQQTFATTAGLTYSVLFDLAGNPEGPPVLKTAEVSAAGKVQDFTFNTAGHSETSMGWTTMDFVFTATSSMTTLSFASLNATAFGPALDNVSVSVIPEPSSLALCGIAGAIGVAVARGRRKRAA
jgi:choice-of-anchor C domain-containing protein